MERQVFVHYNPTVKTGTTALNPFDAVADIGKVPFIGLSGANIPITATKITEPFYVTQITYDPSNPTEEVRKSKLINIADITSAKLVAYKAAIKQVTTLGVFPTTGIVNLKLVRLDKNHTPYDSITYSVDTGASNDLTIDNLIAAINANPRSFVVASGTTTLVLTAKEDGTSFFTALPTDKDGLEISTITITATTTPEEGSGTFAHIKALQEEAAGLGFLNRTYFPQTPTLYGLTPVTVEDVPSVGYDLLYINVKNNNSENVVSGNKVSTIIIAFVTANDTDKSALTIPVTDITEAMFKTMFGL